MGHLRLPELVRERRQQLQLVDGRKEVDGQTSFHRRTRTNPEGRCTFLEMRVSFGSCTAVFLLVEAESVWDGDGGRRRTQLHISTS